MNQGRAHAALVFDGDIAVAWCEYGSPEELPNIYHRKEYEAGLGRLPNYRITCLFVDRNNRRKGMAAVAGGLPAGHSRHEGLGIFPLQRHQKPVRTGRLPL